MVENNEYEVLHVRFEKNGDKAKRPDADQKHSEK